MMTNSGYSGNCCGMGNLQNMTWSADNLALDFVRESEICHPDLGQNFLWKGRGSTTEGEQDLTMGGSTSDL